MAGVDQMQTPIVVERRPMRSDDIRENRAGLQRVDLAGDLDCHANLAGGVGDELRDEAENARNLFALLQQEIGEIVIELDRLHRLDED